MTSLDDNHIDIFLWLILEIQLKILQDFPLLFTARFPEEAELQKILLFSTW